MNRRAAYLFGGGWMLWLGFGLMWSVMFVKNFEGPSRVSGGGRSGDGDGFANWPCWGNGGQESRLGIGCRGGQAGVDGGSGDGPHILPSPFLF